MKHHYTSVKNALIRIYHNSCHSALTRKRKGRIQAGVHNISIDDLEYLWEKQNGRCYYSNIPMNYDKNEWRISLERLDNNKGYINGNVVLCCLEFNTRCQWHLNKVDKILDILSQDVQKVETDFTTNKQKKAKYNKSCKLIQDGKDTYRCSYCNEFKFEAAFRSNQLLYCTECLNKYNRDKTPKQHFAKLLQQSKQCTELRKSKDLYPERGICNITFEDLVELYNEQKGLCAYSGIPLEFGSYLDKDWVISLERLDPCIGYTRDNVCFICIEFNSADQTVKTGKEFGNAGWTPLKFDYFIAHVEHSKGLITDKELQDIIDIQKQYQYRTHDKVSTYNQRKSNYKRVIKVTTQAKRNYGFIYCLTSPSGKMYIGQTDILFQEKHTILCTHKTNKNKLILEEIDKYGEDALKLDRIASCRKDKLEELQEYFIKELNTLDPHGLNPKKRMPKKACKQIADTLITNNIRYGHNNNELPKYVKYHNWADRKGYAIISHPKCKKKDFVSKEKSLDELYDACLTFLSSLEKFKYT